MLVAANFTIMAIFLWVRSGSPLPARPKLTGTVETGEEKSVALVQEVDVKAPAPEETFAVRERELFLPLAVVAGSQFLGVLPLYIFNHASKSVSPIHSPPSLFPFPDLLNAQINSN